MSLTNKPKNRPEGTSRRDLLRYVLGSTALLATNGCASQQIIRCHPKPETTDRKAPFIKQWHEAVAKGLQEFADSPEGSHKLSPENIKELTDVIRNFDPSDYIDRLARKAGISPTVIGGRIKSFGIVPLTSENGPMAAVGFSKHMRLYTGEWMTYQGKIHAPTIRATLRHEMAHMFSFDYSKESKIDGLIPFEYESRTIPGCRDNEHLSPKLYEGATEIVARMGAKDGTDIGLEQGYRGGATLSAFVLSELLGRNDFLKACLTRDTRLLNDLFDTKIGFGAARELTSSVVFGLSFLRLDDLDFLHNAFESEHIDGDRLENILLDAQQKGIPERAAHFKVDGSIITTHLFKLNDADEPPRFAFNAVVKAPSVYHYGKLKSQSGNYFLTEEFGMYVFDESITDSTLNASIDKGVKNLRAHCSLEQDQIILVGAHTVTGYDSFVEERLKMLNKLNPGSQQFESTWSEINSHMVKLLTDTLRTIYIRAGVNNLIVKDKE